MLNPLENVFLDKVNKELKNSPLSVVPSPVTMPIKSYTIELKKSDYIYDGGSFRISQKTVDIIEKVVRELLDDNFEVKYNNTKTIFWVM